MGAFQRDQPNAGCRPEWPMLRFGQRIHTQDSASVQITPNDSPSFGIFFDCMTSTQPVRKNPVQPVRALRGRHRSYPPTHRCQQPQNAPPPVPQSLGEPPYRSPEKPTPATTATTATCRHAPSPPRHPIENHQRTRSTTSTPSTTLCGSRTLILTSLPHASPGK